MSNMIKVAQEFKKALDDSDNRKPKAYDTEAVVSKVEKDTLWVKFPGGETETPVRKAVDAKVGDTVMVRVANHRAWNLGNATSPPTDDTKAIQAQAVALGAKEAADEAWAWADSAHEAADTAWAYADVAHDGAVEALNQAHRATTYANDALTQLGTVEDVVDTLNWVTEHGTMEPTTDTSIDPTHVYFKVDPNGVYIVGDTHYSLVSEPKTEELSTYYILSIDEAVSNYVATHIALTDSGLWVLYDDDANYIPTTDTAIDISKIYFKMSSGGLYVPGVEPKVEEIRTYYERVETGDPTSGYKIRLGNDGMYVYDDHGHLVSTFGRNITFDGDHAQYIGGENAYIIFTPSSGSGSTDTIIIGGNVVLTGSNKTLSETINEINSNIEGSLYYDHNYVLSSDKRTATFTAHVYRGGVDVTDEFNDEQFTWYYKTEVSEDPIPINTNTSNNPQNCGKTISVSLSLMGYGGEVVGYFTTASNQRLLRSNGDELADSNNTPFTARSTSSGTTVRVRDLEYITTLYPTDGVLIVGSETEKLATISTLSDMVDKHYVYEQATPSAEWTVTHNLRKHPSIEVVDSAGTVVIGEYDYIDLNNVRLIFGGAFAGKAYFN